MTSFYSHFIMHIKRNHLFIAYIIYIIGLLQYKYALLTLPSVKGNSKLSHITKDIIDKSNFLKAV